MVHPIHTDNNTQGLLGAEVIRYSPVSLGPPVAGSPSLRPCLWRPLTHYNYVLGGSLVGPACACRPDAGPTTRQMGMGHRTHESAEEVAWTWDRRRRCRHPPSRPAAVVCGGGGIGHEETCRSCGSAPVRVPCPCL